MSQEKKTQLEVFANRVLGKVVGSKGDEVTQERRRPRNESLYDLHYSPNIVRLIQSSSVRWACSVARGEGRGMCKDLVWRPGVRRPL